MSISTLPIAGPDYTAIKSRQRQTWASGDYHVIASIIVPVSERLCDAIDLRAGERVLDVATGSGNTAIAAARRLCEVTGVDYVPELLERGSVRAAAEGFYINFVEGDAEAMPAADAAYDVVLSTFGAMFAPNQEQAAQELLRACRSGGRIGLANWTPDGWIGEIFRIVSRQCRRRRDCGRPPAGAPRTGSRSSSTTGSWSCGRNGEVRLALRLGAAVPRPLPHLSTARSTRPSGRWTEPARRRWPGTWSRRWSDSTARPTAPCGAG